MHFYNKSYFMFSANIRSDSSLWMQAASMYCVLPEGLNNADWSSVMDQSICFVRAWIRTYCTHTFLQQCISIYKVCIFCMFRWKVCIFILKILTFDSIGLVNVRALTGSFLWFYFDFQIPCSHISCFILYVHSVVAPLTQPTNPNTIN